MCNKCISFHGICLQNGWNTTEKKRAKIYLCETPWDQKYKTHPVIEKARWYYRFRAFFHAPDSIMPPMLCENHATPPPSSGVSIDAGISINNTTPPASTTPINAHASTFAETATAGVAIMNASPAASSLL